MQERNACNIKRVSAFTEYNSLRDRLVNSLGVWTFSIGKFFLKSVLSNVVSGLEIFRIMQAGYCTRKRAELKEENMK